VNKDVYKLEALKNVHFQRLLHTILTALRQYATHRKNLLHEGLSSRRRHQVFCQWSEQQMYLPFLSLERLRIENGTIVSQFEQILNFLILLKFTGFLPASFLPHTHSAFFCNFQAFRFVSNLIVNKLLPNRKLFLPPSEHTCDGLVHNTNLYMKLQPLVQEH
jgi:hypothetical protein